MLVLLPGICQGLQGVLHHYGVTGPFQTKLNKNINNVDNNYIDFLKVGLVTYLQGVSIEMSF